MPHSNHHYNKVELHLNPDPDLVRKYGRRIKNAGGSYRACRGYSTRRCVFLPATEDELIDTLVESYPLPKTVMIARDSSTERAPAWVKVHYFTKADRAAKRSPSFVLAMEYAKAVANAITRGIRL